MNMPEGYGTRLARTLTMSPDPAIYTSQETWQAERAQVFAASWQYVGDARSLARTGDHLASSFAGYRVLVVRQSDGGLKAFHNICRHRAAPVVETDGYARSAVLTCPYHRWAYGLDGGLRTTPEFGDVAGFRCEDHGLLPVHVEDWRGHVFVHLGDNPEPLESALTDLPDLVGDRPLERCELFDSWYVDFDANWKVYTENYVEGYHVPSVHLAFDAELESGTFVTRAHNKTVTMRATAKAGGLYEGLWTWTWPTFTLVLFPGGYDVSRICPISPEKTRVHFDIFVDPEANLSDEQKAATSKGVKDLVSEDMAISEAVHANLASGVFPGGPLSPRHEEGVALLHDMLRKAGVA
jgi:choline monooxygenase